SAALTVDRLVFRPDGFARNSATPNGALLNATFSVCMPTRRPAENERLVAIGSGSRLTTVARARDGACNASPDSPRRWSTAEMPSHKRSLARHQGRAG